MSKRAKIMLEFVKGGIVPADGISVGMIRERGYRVGDIVAADLVKPRNPSNHRKAHRLGQLLVENLDAFAHLDCHTALKRIQVEGDIGCDYMALLMPGVGPVNYRVPRSLSYASLDEAEFLRIYDAMCAYIARTYWSEMEPDQIAEMAELMVQAA